MTVTADIVIVGGGIAGFSAAVAAAREGKDVLLIEKRDSVGGDSAYANVGTICGAYYRTSNATARLAGYSFSKEFIHALQQRDHHAKCFMHTNGLYIIPYEWSALQQLYVDILRQANVRCLFAADVTNVSVENQIINELQVLHQNELLTIKTKRVIDCTGQAMVSQLVGIETIREESYQAASQVFRLGNIVDTNEFTLNMALKRAVIKNLERMQWPDSYKAISIVPGSFRENQVDIKFTLEETITDRLINDLDFKITSRKRTEVLITVLKAEVTSLLNATTEIIFPQPGIRVVQRSHGQHILTEEDVMDCATTPDGIAIGTWPIEIWNTDGSLEMKYFEEEKGYEISARCLMSDKIRNLYFAGKNISATSRAIASARVMGTAIQTGYAAGKMACAANDEELKSTIEKLHHELRQVQ